MASHKNFSYSTVATAPSPADSGTSLTVAAGEGANFVIGRNAVICPTATFPLTTNAEIVTVTNIVGDVLTITRAQEGTAARVVVVTDQIFNAITAKVVNDLEQAVSVVSNALSVETAARTTKDNTLSDGISVVSAAVVVASALASTADAHADTVSAAVVVASALASTADAHANTVSAAVVAVSASLTSVASIASAAASAVAAVSAAVTSVNNRVSGVSGNLTSGLTRLDAVSASLTSVASIASAAASAAAAVSANHTSLVSDVGRVSLNVSAMSTKVDVVSLAVATVSASLTSVASIASAAASAAAAASADVTSLASDVGRMSLNASAMSSRLSNLSDRVSALEAAPPGSASVTSAEYLSLVNRVSANSGTGGGGSVTSAEVVDAVSVETANRISAVNVVSAAVVAVSASLTSVASIASAAASAAAAASGAAATVSAAHTSLVSDVGRLSVSLSGTISSVSALSTQVTNVSASLTSVASIASAAASAAAVVSAAVTSVNNRVSAISSNLTSGLTRLDAVSASLTSVASIASAAASAAAAASGAAAAVSANLTSLRSDVGRLSVVVSALNAGTGSVTSAELGAAVSIGQILSLQNVDGSAASAGCPVYAFTSANTFKLGNASATSAKHIVGLVIDSNIAISAVGRIQTQGQVTLTTAQWDSITGGSGGLTAGSTYYLDAANGKMTTTAPSVTIRRPIGVGLSTTVMFLHNAQEWDALSDAVSVGTATANSLSLNIASVNDIVSGMGNTGQLRVVAGSQTAFSAATKISGLSLSLANSVYTVEGMVAFSCSGAASINFGFSTSAAAFGLFVGFWQVMRNVVSSEVASVVSVQTTDYANFNTQNTTQVACLGTTGIIRYAKVEALIRVTTPGSIQMKGTAVTGGPLTILQGSCLRAFRVG